jgi:hypothetical protein
MSHVVGGGWGGRGGGGGGGDLGARAVWLARRSEGVQRRGLAFGRRLDTWTRRMRDEGIYIHIIYIYGGHMSEKATAETGKRGGICITEEKRVIFLTWPVAMAVWCMRSRMPAS